MITNEQKENLLQQYYDRGVLKKEIRSYEVSLWTLQDEFITVLKWSDVEQRGRIENGKMTLNIDGTQKLTFSIPMYYQLNGKLIENPSWHNAQGQLLKGLRKIKVIFNKGEFSIAEASKHVFEFVIMDVEDSHENDILTCDVSAEGLAFQELGKIGYKINLSQDNFELVYKDWEENDGSEETRPIQNLDYWCGECGLVKYGSEPVNSRTWYYDVQMNWNSFEGIVERDPSKLYEEAYTTSWNNNLTPNEMEKRREKARAIEVEHSNLYNITQTIAEKFGIFCRYEYLYDDNYNITGKKIVFYNNFMQEDPANTITLQYPYSSSKVSRKLESAEVTTKLFVLDVDDSSVAGGYCSIMEAPPNFSHEDYILNFDYMLESGGINKEQYVYISEYNQKMREINEALTHAQLQYNTYSMQKPEVEAKLTVANNSIDIDEEQELQNTALRNALDAKDGISDGYIQLSPSNADYILVSTVDGAQYISLKYANKGIVEDSIEIYTTKHNSTNGPVLGNKIEDYSLDYEVDTNNLIGITLKNPADLVTASNVDWAQLFKTYYTPSDYNGNVNLMNRPIVPASDFIAAGYTDFDGTYGTLYSASFIPLGENNSAKASNGKYYELIYTPVKADGTVLDESTVNNYLDTIVDSGNTPQEWMAADKKGHGILIQYVETPYFNIHIPADTWASHLHELQEEWDMIRADNNWFGYDSNPANIEFEAPDYDNLEFCPKSAIDENTTATTSNHVYIVYKYNPTLYYDNIVKMWQTKNAKDTADKEKLEADLAIIEAKIEELKEQVDDLIVEKEKEVKAFERMMGPALREGYWQPENYNDYGEHHVQSGTITNEDITLDSNDGAIIAWDEELFEEEQTLYYEIGINQTTEFYPCIDLTRVFPNGIPFDLSEYSLVWKATNLPEYEYDWYSIKDLKVFSVGSQALIRFIKNNGTIKPVLVIIGAKTMSTAEITRMVGEGEAQLEKYSVTVTDGVINVSHTNITPVGANWIQVAAGSEKESVPMVYPRIKFSSLLLKTDSSNFVIRYNDNLLEVGDYYIRTRNTLRSTDNNYYAEYYVTIKPEIIIKYGIGNDVTVDYVLSNANTSIYLDALEVSKENAYPKASYTVSTSMLDVDLTHRLYSTRAQIVMVNDTELKLHNAFGYISQVELDLDHYENDSIEVKNYKTKFEDLFSTIIAQTEAMKQMGSGIGAAVNGNIPLSVKGMEQTLLNQHDIMYAYLDSHFDDSSVVVERLASLFDEAGEILSDSNKAIKSIRAVSAKNANILSGFAQRIQNELNVKVTKSKEKPDSFKVGDIWIQTDNNGKEIGRYIATASSANLTGDSTGTGGFVRTYDGTLASITGAALDVNADEGTVDIKAANAINIASGNTVSIAANENVNIVGNKEVNIGGTTINIGSLENNGSNVGGINIIAAKYDTVNFENVKQSRVLIHPEEIEMAGSKITMLTRIDDNGVNAISLDGANGIWVGSSKSITLSSTSNTSNANIELNPNHILFGVTNLNSNSNAVTEITEDYIIFGVGNAIDDLSNNNTNIEMNGSLTGMRLTKDKIGLAVGTGNNRSVFIADTDGVFIGTGTTNKTLKTGSYVSISGGNVEIGSLGNLYLNTNNVKLQTDITYGTRFALGQNLQSTDSVNGVSSSTDVGLVYNTNGLFIRGDIYADNGYFNGDVNANTFIATSNKGKFIASGDSLGFYTTATTLTPIMTLSGSTMTVASDYIFDIDGDLNIDADNFGIKSNANSNEAMFRLGSENNPALEYKNGTLSVTGTITANALYIMESGTPTEATQWINAKVTDKAIWLGVKNYTNTNATTIKLTDSSVEIQSGGILSVDTSNVIINTNGGNNSTIFELKNGNTEYFAIKNTNNVIGATLGGWSILGNKIYSGSDTSYVALDANPSDTYGIWCGNAASTSAPFRVKRNGSVYLNSLMVLDKKDANNNWGLGGTDNDHEGIYTVTEGTDEQGTYGYKAIDFSKLNFNQAVSITPVWGGGDTLGVKVSLWGVVNKTRNFNITFDPSISDITGTSEGGSYYNLDLNYEILIDGSSFIVDHTNVVVGADYVWKEGFNDAVGTISYEPGEKTITVPKETSNVTIRSEEKDISATWNAGWNACRAEMLNSAYTVSYYTGTQSQAYDPELDTWYNVLSPYSSTTVTKYVIPEEQ